MTGSTQSFTAYIMELLDPIRGIEAKRFFGGIGLTAAGTQFAMMMGDTLYFVVDDRSRPAYERMGSNCFSYRTKKGVVNVRKYYEVPAEKLEDRDDLVALAREAIKTAKKLA